MTTASSSMPFPEFYGIAFPMLDRRQIADLRKRMGFSQAEMAAALGVASRLTVSQWETGVSVPGGPAMRFLSLLDSLSNPELRKIIKQLENIMREEAPS